MLSVFLDLLRHGKTNPNPRFILTPTAVAHTFCRNHNGCETYDGIRDIVEFLETELMEQLGLDSGKRVVRERVIILPFLYLINPIIFIGISDHRFAERHRKCWHCVATIIGRTRAVTSQPKQSHRNSSTIHLCAHSTRL